MNKQIDPNKIYLFIHGNYGKPYGEALFARQSVPFEVAYGLASDLQRSFKYDSQGWGWQLQWFEFSPTCDNIEWLSRQLSIDFSELYAIINM